MDSIIPRSSDIVPLCSSSIMQQTKATLPVIQQCTNNLRQNKPFAVSANTIEVWGNIDQNLAILNVKAVEYDTAIVLVLRQIATLQEQFLNRLKPEQVEAMDEKKKQQAVTYFKKQIDQLKTSVDKLGRTAPLTEFIGNFRKSVRIAGTEWAKSMEKIDTNFGDLIAKQDETFAKILDPLEERITELNDQINKLDQKGKEMEMNFWKKKFEAIDKRNDGVLQKEETVFDLMIDAEPSKGLFWFSSKREEKEKLAAKHADLQKRHQSFENKLDSIQQEYRKARKEFEEARNVSNELENQLKQTTREYRLKYNQKLESIKSASDKTCVDRQSLESAVKYFGVNSSLVELLEAINQFGSVADHGSNVHSKLQMFFEIAINNFTEVLDNIDNSFGYESSHATLTDQDKQPFVQPNGLLLKY